LRIALSLFGHENLDEKKKMTVSSRGSQERRNAMVEYLKQMSAIVSESDDKEQRTQALGAIMTEIKAKEALIATDQKLSKVLEKLIESNGTTLEVVKAILDRFTPLLSDVSYDQYGSHVIETAVKALGRVEADDELKNIVSGFTDSIVADIYNLAADKKSTFVLRTVLLVFSGITLGEGDMLEELKKASCENMLYPSEFNRILDAVSWLDATTLDALASESHSSFTLQVMIIAGSKSKSNILTSLLRSFFTTESGAIDTQRVLSSLESPAKSKMLEVAITYLSSNELKRKLLDELIDPKSVLCSIDGEEEVQAESTSSFFSCKFSFGFVQAFIVGIQDVESAADFVERVLSPSGMGTLVRNGKSLGIGVIQKMAEKIITIIPPQKAFFENLSKALGAEKDNLWMSILSLNFNKPACASAIDEAAITPQGCLLMSTLFQCKVSSVQGIVSHAKVFFDHLARADPATSRLFTDIGPGRMIQTLISRESCFPSNMKSKVIRQIMLTDDAPQRLERFSNDRRVGAWLITTAWDSADMQTKQALGEALFRVNGLRDSNWKIWKHCGLATFSRRKDEWVHTENRKEKAKGFLRDIIGSDFTANKKQRKYIG
jgi:hypothetical protein